MQVFLIDPFEKTVEAVEHNGNWREMLNSIGASRCAVLPIEETGDDLYVSVDAQDSDSFLQAYFSIRCKYPPVAGKALVMGRDQDRMSSEPSVPLTYYRDEVVWLTVQQALNFSPTKYWARRDD